MSFFAELKRRNVVRVGVLYIVASWLILQVADVLFDAMELPSTWMRLILAILILCFPLALIFAWVFEMTPEGIKRERDIDRSQSVTPQTGAKINTLIVVLLMLAIAAVVVDRLIPETAIAPGIETATVDEPTAPVNEAADAAGDDPVVLPGTTTEEKSVAVLPFVNRSANESDIYFVDGIHDDILTQLARIGDLKVISRTSVEKFRNTTQSMGEIGAVLGVQNILEGGVQRAGNRVRINVQLIDVESDEHLWAESYDRKLTTENIFAIQSEIATAIAQALKATLSPEEQAQLATAQTHNLEALEAYFQGRRAMAKRTSASLEEAAQHFERAIKLDPDYALAYVGLADSYTLRAYYSEKTSEEQEMLARPLVDKALAIDDRLGEAYVSRAQMNADDDPVAAEADFRKGIELAPSYVSGHHWYAVLLINAEGRREEALISLKKAASLDPMSAIVRKSLGDLYAFLGRFEESREQLEASVRIDPEFASGYDSLGVLELTVSGRLDLAAPLLHRSVFLDPGNPQYVDNLAHLWTDLGGFAEGDALLQRLRTFGRSHNLRVSEMMLPLMRSGPSETVRVAAEAVAANNGGWNREIAIYLLGLANLESGDGERALARYREVFPKLFADDPEISDGNYVAALNLAWLIRQTGAAERSDLLLDRSLAYMRGLPLLGPDGSAPYQAYAYAVRGERRRALEALGEAADAGWRYFWRVFLKFDPAFATLHDDPEFQAIVAQVEADMAAQLANVRAMVARGELPPLPPVPAR